MAVPTMKKRKPIWRAFQAEAANAPANKEINRDRRAPLHEIAEAGDYGFRPVGS